MNEPAKKNYPKPTVMEQMFPGRFLNAALLLGKRVTLTISAADVEDLEGDDGTKARGVLSFKQTDKQLVLNRTNALCIKAMFGGKLADWIGKRVTLHEETAKVGGETKPAIRIWGSPDIESDKRVKIQLPRRKATDRTLHKVEKSTDSKGPANAATSTDRPGAPRAGEDDARDGDTACPAEPPESAAVEKSPEEKAREEFGF